MSIAATTTTLGGGDYRWLKSARGTEHPVSGTLDYSAFTDGTHFPDGYFPSGLSLTYSTSTGLYGPFAGGAPGTANEVQTATIGGSGLTSSDTTVLDVGVTATTLVLTAKARGTAELRATRLNNTIVRIPNTAIRGVPQTITVT